MFKCAPANVTYHKGHCRHEISRLAAKQSRRGLVRHTYSPVVCRQWDSVRSNRGDEISLRLSRVKHRCPLNVALSIPTALTTAWAGHIGDAHLFGARASCMRKCLCAHMHSCPCSAVKTSGWCPVYVLITGVIFLCFISIFPNKKILFRIILYSHNYLFASFRRSWQLAFNSVDW